MQRVAVPIGVVTPGRITDMPEITGWRWGREATLKGAPGSTEADNVDLEELNHEPRGAPDRARFASGLLKANTSSWRERKSEPMPPLVLTQTQTFNTPQASARIVPTISRMCRHVEGRTLGRMRDRQTTTQSSRCVQARARWPRPPRSASPRSILRCARCSRFSVL